MKFKYFLTPLHGCFPPKRDPVGTKSHDAIFSHRGVMYVITSNTQFVTALGLLQAGSASVRPQTAETMFISPFSQLILPFALKHTSSLSKEKDTLSLRRSTLLKGLYDKMIYYGYTKKKISICHGY